MKKTSRNTKIVQYDNSSPYNFVLKLLYQEGKCGGGFREKWGKDGDEFQIIKTQYQKPIPTS